MSAQTSAEWPVLSIKGSPDPEVLGDIRALTDAAAEADGNPPLSEQTWVNLKSVDPDNLLVLASYAGEERSDPSTATSLAGVAVVNLPAHGDHEGAAKLAGRFGFAPVRELWRMRLTHAPQLPDVVLPDGVSIRAFVPGKDEQAWLAANAAAFAHHPEQGSTTLADLQARMAEDWFDPAGFLLAVRNNDDALLGFHWTKVHPRTGTHPSIGEVYVVGVTPEAQGTGLGKALTIAGMKHLHEQGQQAIMLYVDADNEAAVALYRKLGFTRWDTDVMYGPAGTEGS